MILDNIMCLMQVSEKRFQEKQNKKTLLGEKLLETGEQWCAVASLYFFGAPKV